MPNLRIEQLRRNYQGSLRMALFATVGALVFVAVTFTWFGDSAWGWLTFLIALVLGGGAWGNLKGALACSSELRNLQLIDAQHVHGTPDPFVKAPPATPEPSSDNFWGQR